MKPCAVCFLSRVSDPATNLALEESLLDQRPAFGSALLLYVNDPALVIGRNQNPWRECNVAVARREGVPILRRLSGGGTVYHDAGNVNYSLMLPRSDYDACAAFDGVRRALANLGVHSEVRRKTNLYAGNRKFSGTAFCYRRTSVVHHGTLLVRSDLARLTRLLKPCLPGLMGRSVPSVPAEVVNLSDLVPGMETSDVIQALRQELAPGADVLEPSVDGSVSGRRARLVSWEEVFAPTPPFDVRFDSPGGFIECSVQDGTIRRAVLNGAVALTALIGIRFGAEDMARAAQAAGLPATWAAHWLANPF